MKSDSTSEEVENSKSGNQEEEKELAEPISFDFDIWSVKNDKNGIRKSSGEDFFETPISL